MATRVELVASGNQGNAAWVQGQMLMHQKGSHIAIKTYEGRTVTIPWERIHVVIEGWN